jgi:putative hemolysin
MTPRSDIDWIDVNCTREDIRAALAATPHSRIPIARGSVDDIVGVVSARDLLIASLDGQELNLARLAKSAPVIPDLMDAMDALAVLRGADVPLALVHDEYGHLDGIVTPGSLLSALAGAFAHDLDVDHDPPALERDDGSWLLSGAASADVLQDRLGMQMPADRDYSTVAGFALSILKRIPEIGESFSVDGWKFEVVDMDGRKIDKLLASRLRRRRKEDAESSQA